MTRREPEFSAEDVDLLLEWQHGTHDLGPHGQPMSEALSPLADPMNRKHGEWFYTAEAITDYAEKAKQDAIDAFRASEGGEIPNGVTFVVRKNERKRPAG